ncbi:MAG: N-methyl-L-tryptophan oxidase [Halieaceae bacterium]
MTHYDLIVLGTGGVGSACMCEAARRGLKVLGLDRFPPAHDRGSSHGESRMIRMSYFEHPDYVPLLRRSYQLWDQLDSSLLHRSGVFYAGPPDGEVLSAVRASAEQYQLALQELKPQDYSQYQLPPGHQAVFEPDAGWLPVERCVTSHLERAIAAGAEHRWDEAVNSWAETGNGTLVSTELGHYTAERLIITAGAWNPQLLSDLQLPLTVTRKHVHWYPCADKRYRSGFFLELEQGQFYGFPAMDGRLKLGEHSGGEALSDPLQASREPDAEDSARVQDFVSEHLPGVDAQALAHQSCFYTMTTDANFIVDRVADSSRVAFAAGLSGHGFKFAPVLAEILVDLVCEGGTDFNIDFLGQNRETLQG